MGHFKIFIIVIMSFSLILGCKKNDNQATKSAPVIKISEEELMKKYGSKKLSNEQVNKIIDSIKWTTNSNYEILGSKDAKKGGMFIEGRTDYPATLRSVGENTANSFNSTLTSLVHESLLGMHQITMEYTPGLADKWSITDDKMTYFFHIDQRAKWQDGYPITAYDCVATWDLLVSDGIKDPFSQEFWNQFERPVTLSKDIIMVKPKSLEWNNFLYFTGDLLFFPEHIIGRITPEQYMKDYQNKLMVGTGPYILQEAKTNDYIIMKRDPNWWGLQDPSSQGLYNFERIKFVFYSDENILEEKFKKGEIDVYNVIMARKWANEFVPEKLDSIKYNHIIRQRIYTNTPNGLSGYAFNMREEPFNDVRVRKAVYMLLNREKMMEKLFYNEYQYMDSYYANSPYKNKNNPKIRYSPEKAVELLEQAGYSQKNMNKDGYILKNGKVFELNLNVYSSDTRVETIFQEELKNVGIKLNINKVTWAKHIKDLDERNFKIATVGYTGLIFPNPISSFHSELADKPNTNNIWGLKNKRVDEISELYNKEFDINKRIKLIIELDGILANGYLMALRWYSNNSRLLYWNKFGMPEFVLNRFSSDPMQSMITYWWFDEKANKDLKNIKGHKKMLPAKPSEVKYWEKYQKNF